MKLPWEKKYLCWAITAFCTVAASVLFYMILKQWDVVKNMIGLVLKSLQPIIVGLIIAYLLNPLTNIIEKRLVIPITNKMKNSKAYKTILEKSAKGKDKPRKKSRRKNGAVRAVSIILTWLVVGLFAFVLVSLVAPEVIRSIEMILKRLPEYAKHIADWFSGLLEKNPEILQTVSQVASGLAYDVQDIMEKVIGLVPRADVIIMEISSSVYSIVPAIINVFVGIIVSVYVLKDKEKFKAQFKKLFFNIMPEKSAKKVMYLFGLSHEKFGSFLTGKIFDSIIIGLLCFVILILFDIPYAALVSTVVGITNIIPFFGPFIGAIPSAILILCESPAKCLTFIIIILLIQQFDGNILGPKILGTTTGMSSFWVLTAILLGSGLFGLWGMVCAVPVFAVGYTLLRSFCNKSLNKNEED